MPDGYQRHILIYSTHYLSLLVIVESSSFFLGFLIHYKPNDACCLAPLPLFPSLVRKRQSQQFGTPGSRFEPPLLPAPWMIGHTRLYDGVACQFGRTGGARRNTVLKTAISFKMNGIFSCAIAAQIRPACALCSKALISHLGIAKSHIR